MRLLLKIGCLALLTIPLKAGAQSQTPRPTPEPSDILRINTDSVQTDAMVFDHQVRFVNSLESQQSQTGAKL